MLRQLPAGVSFRVGDGVSGRRCGAAGALEVVYKLKCTVTEVWALTWLPSRKNGL